MNLIDTFKQADTEVDFYSEKRKAVYATIDQLADALGYKNRKGIERLLERHSYLLGNEYSIISTISTPQGVGPKSEINQQQTNRKRGEQKTREMRLFNRQGIYEVFSISTMPKGREIRKQLFKYMEWLENRLHLATVEHIKSIPTQNKLHQVIKESPVYCEYEGQRLRNAFTNFNNLINKTACLGVNKPKESMTAEELKRLEHIEHLVIYLLGEGKNYGQIKAELLPSKEEKGA